MKTCRRCGSGEQAMYITPCGACGEEACAYCEACLSMGRVRACSPLLRGIEPPVSGLVTKETNRPTTDRVATAEHAEQLKLSFKVKNQLIKLSKHVGNGAFPPTNAPEELAFEALLKQWGLSPAQYEASLQALRFLQQVRERRGSFPADQPPGFLIWAVTGAGKTEMIFPLIHDVLNRGGRVVVATPRRDVVLELKPRIQQAFALHKVIALFGGSDERWEEGAITLATTHQLMRYYQAFDLVVIDELDAFPFINDPQLEFAARQVCRPSGAYLFLSATPPTQLQRAAKRWGRGRLAHVKVPVRFHRHPLPVPIMHRIPTLRRLLAARTLPSSLTQSIHRSLERGAQLFVFVAQISYIEPLLAKLRIAYPEVAIEGTSSQDPQRADKVISFRQGAIRILITTTILERGVTVPRTDVFILDADAALFDASSLVQMAGRAGRSKDDPHGNVSFWASAKTLQQVHAVKQIKAMNRIARKKGYLLPQFK